MSLSIRTLRMELSTYPPLILSTTTPMVLISQGSMCLLQAAQWFNLPMQEPEDWGQLARLSPGLLIGKFLPETFLMIERLSRIRYCLCFDTSQKSKLIYKRQSVSLHWFESRGLVTTNISTGFCDSSWSFETIQIPPDNFDNLSPVCVRMSDNIHQ